MVDIRDRVEEDRGVLKKIQLLVPGFRGYRQREDIRAADNILRIQLADKLQEGRKELEKARGAMVQKYMTKNLDSLGGLINKFQMVDGEVRHAEQGYSGISATLQVKQEELDKLYEFDYSLINNALRMKENIGTLIKAANAGDANQLLIEINNIRSMIEGFEATFKRRTNLITGVEV